MPGRDTGDAEDLLRTLAPQVLGAVVRRYGHFSAAEDAVQEALLAAAVQWPDAGVPSNPQGWLITVAARRLTDLLRAEQTRQRREETAARRMLPGEWLARPADHPAPDSDDTLILLFLCCHPALSAASQMMSVIIDPNGTVHSLAGEPSLALKMGIADRRTILNEIAKRSPGPRYNEITFTHADCGKEVTLAIDLGDLFLN